MIKDNKENLVLDALELSFECFALALDTLFNGVQRLTDYEQEDNQKLQKQVRQNPRKKARFNKVSNGQRAQQAKGENKVR